MLFTFNLRDTAEAKKELLTPPVCNTMISNEGALKLMLIGGPNKRDEYHYNQGEEIFYQIKGDMCLKVIEHNKPKDVIIKEGEFFVLPCKVPHSPQRFANTFGFVIERCRLPHETDGMRFFVDKTAQQVLWQKFAHVTDLSKDLVPVINEFHATESYRTREPLPIIPPADFEGDSEADCPTPKPLMELLKHHVAQNIITTPVTNNRSHNTNNINNSNKNDNKEYKTSNHEKENVNNNINDNDSGMCNGDLGLCPLVKSDNYKILVVDKQHTASNPVPSYHHDVLIWLICGKVQILLNDETVCLSKMHDMVHSVHGIDSCIALTDDTLALLITCDFLIREGH